MFLHMSVILSTGGLADAPPSGRHLSRQTPPGQTTPCGQTPPGQTPLPLADTLQADTPQADKPPPPQ